MDAVTRDLNKYMDNLSKQDKAFERLLDSLESDEFEEIRRILKSVKNKVEMCADESGFDFYEDIASELYNLIDEEF